MKYRERLVCDFCGEETDHAECWPPRSGYYCINQAIIQFKTGDKYDEFERVKTLNVNMCPKCFLEKLMPWLESQGIKVREETWSD